MASRPSDAGQLRLDRSKANLTFSSWRLCSSIERAEGSLALPAAAVAATAGDTDYVSARHAALLNGLAQQPHGYYTFLEDGPSGQGLALYQLDLEDPATAPTMQRVCGLPSQQGAAAPGPLTAGSLPPSAVEVQCMGSSAGIGPRTLMLLSSGNGELHLAVRPAGDAAGAELSLPVHPLRPAPPLQGVRPVHLSAAFLLPLGASTQLGAAEGRAELCCVAWAPRPRSERQPSRCEVYAVLLAAELAPGQQPTLRVLGVQLLKVSDLPPHGVLANPATGGVLLALQPSPGAAAEEAAAQRAAMPAAMEEAGRAEEREGDVSPRTLAAAVARLAAYTSEEPVGPLPHQQYADLYRESGADGVGAMGSEPTCTLFTFALAPSSGGGTEGAALQTAQEPVQQGSLGSQPLLRLVHTLSCQPHKLLTCHLQPPPFGAEEPPTPDTHMPISGSRGAGSNGLVAGQQQQQPEQPGGHSAASSAGCTLLLGLTDDVDCAVVAVRCSDAGSVGTAGEGGEGGNDAAAAGFVVEHVSSIPALAYVAAGKVQRKYLVLAPLGGDICGALLEASKYCYLYRCTGTRQEYGEHQVVDMELPDSSGRGLLGAALAGGRAGACRLVLLARDGLRVIDM